MSTIQELIDSGDVVLGETKVRRNSWPDPKAWAIVYFKDEKPQEWICQDNEGTGLTAYPTDDWQVYVEPTEMEDRWLWSDKEGYVRYLIKPTEHYKIRIEGTKTSFPKEIPDE